MTVGVPHAANVDEYIATFPPRTQAALKQLRELIKTGSPDAEESISYAMPAYKRNGKVMIYFAGYEHHVSLYPLPDTISNPELADEIKPYVAGRGTMRFIVDQPLPIELIEKVIAIRANT